MEPAPIFETESRFEPLVRMGTRLQRAREDSNTAYFFDLMNAGELATKLTAAALIAAVADDPERHRYRQMHGLVRADGVGDWAASIVEIVTGPTAQYLVEDFRVEQRQLVAHSGGGSWQLEAVSCLRECLRIASGQQGKPTPFAYGHNWFTLFAQVRNAAKAHGAPSSEHCGQLAALLETSCGLMLRNFNLYRRQWAYLHRNLSGKYRVVPLSKPTTEFDPYRKSKGPVVPDGVYVWAGAPLHVELLFSGPDATDFFLPNGGFTEKKFETLSYISGDKRNEDSSPYLSPPGDLPKSETHGLETLDIVGETFSNLPPPPAGYVGRATLEDELQHELLLHDRHPIITLSGSGGIGKTSLALTVLHKLATEGSFTAILWFSARDIDLTMDGAKPVRPRVLSRFGLIDAYYNLMHTGQASKAERTEAVESALRGQTGSGPILFVVDNFETVSGPLEIFHWLDANVRPPNKVLITSRAADFKANFDIPLVGMTEPECNELIAATARRLGISWEIKDNYRERLISESDGHPYVIKILLGEAAKAGSPVPIQRIVADRTNLLDALFERTYSVLSPGAQKIFLTMACWRSAVPQLAIEAAMLSPANDERFDVDAAVEELLRSSFLEESTSDKDGHRFLYMPLAASIFGKRKLVLHPLRGRIESDAETLRMFGTAQRTGVRHGLEPRVRSLFSAAAKGTLDEHREMLEYVASKYPTAWLALGKLYWEANRPEKAKEYFARLLEAQPEPETAKQAWEAYAALSRESSDLQGEIQALVAIAELPGSSYQSVSNAANRFNQIIYDNPLFIQAPIKRVLAGRIAAAMEKRIGDADATDLSRLGWLHLHSANEKRARAVAERGKELDPTNPYCGKLLRRFEGN